MTQVRESLASECKELLIRLERWIAADRFLRHQNSSIEIEYVFRSMLNLVYGWQLNNANDLFGRNQDAFDLSDESNRVVVQVTVTESAQKIRETLKKFVGKYDSKYKRLVFVYPVISPAESRADFSSDLNGFDFDAHRDRLGFGSILSSAQAELLAPLRDLLREELGTLADGIPLHARGGTRTESQSPTLILSAYAKPLPEDLLSTPCYPSTSWASESEMTVLPLSYASTRTDDRIKITPINPYVAAIQNGGPLHTLTTQNPWYGVFHFPTFDVKIVNNTDKTIFFHEAEFRVSTSKPNRSAVPAVLGPMGSLYVHFRNLGWGEMMNASLQFALIPIAEDEVEDAQMQLPEVLPHRLELGTFDHSKAFTLLPFFQIEDIDTGRLAALLNTHWDSDDSKVHLQREMEFCYEAENPDEEDRYVYTKELPRADYEFFLKEAAGRFYKSRPCLAGVLEYDESSINGDVTHRSVTVFALLDFAQYGYGAAAPPSNEYHVKLDVEGTDYVRNLQISHALKTGETDRFLIQVAAEKSSFHDLTFALRFNNDEVVEALVQLEVFCSPLDSHYASRQEFGQQ